MADDAIKNILLSMGLYSLGLSIVGSERELFRLFKNDFKSLMQKFAEGV